MNLKGVISISGKAGLSKIVKQSRTGIIVESLVDGKRFPVQGTERVSSIEEISMYTHEKDVLLSDILESLYKETDGKKSISHKSTTAELKAEFEKVLPDYDEERVYSSDIKKVFQWYNLLIDKGLMAEEPEEEEDDEKEEKTENKAAPKKKAVAKKKETTKMPAKAAKKAAPKMGKNK